MFKHELGISLIDIQCVPNNRHASNITIRWYEAHVEAFMRYISPASRINSAKKPVNKSSSFL